MIEALKIYCWQYQIRKHNQNFFQLLVVMMLMH
jgi:hypothetical protein